MIHHPPSPRRGPVFLGLACGLALMLGGCAATAPSSPAASVTRTDSVSLASQTARTALQSLNPAPEDTAPIPPSLTMAPAAVAIDPLNPERALDLDDVQADADLWARVRRGFAISDLDTELVRKAEQYYAARPDYVDRMTERGGRYLFHVIEEIEKRGMPAELALLPFIESAFNPQAMSTAKASGMWQFVPATGKDFALKQSVFRDDRRDVLASTRAALDYLGRLHNQFGDWHLALAAYNWGQGNVQRAIARNEKAGLPTDYLNLRMPDETRYYVPKLQAIKNIVNRPAAFALSLPALKNHPYFLSVPIERDIDLELAARLAGVGVDEFKQLNPQMNKPVILAAGTEQVLLPYDNAARFIANLRAHPGPLASWTAWVAPRTLRPGDAARQVGMTEAQLREINRIPPRMLVKSGSTLLVPRSAARTEDVSEHLADNAVMALTPDTPPLRRVGIKAGKRGDTVAAVAQRYRVSAAQVAQWNKVSTGASFKAGATIVVYLPQAPARVATSAARSTARPVTTRPAATTKPAAKPVKPVRVAQG